MRSEPLGGHAWYRMENWFRAGILLASVGLFWVAAVMIYDPSRLGTGTGWGWKAHVVYAINALVGAGLVYLCAKCEFDLWPRVPLITFSIMLPAWIWALTEGRFYSRNGFGLYSAPFLLACIALLMPYLYSTIDENE